MVGHLPSIDIFCSYMLSVGLQKSGVRKTRDFKNCGMLKNILQVNGLIDDYQDTIL